MAREAVNGRLTRLQAVVDVIAVLALVPLSAIGAGVVIGVLSNGMPSIPVVVLLQALLVLAGAYILLAAREQGFADVGLHSFRGGDLGRGLLVILAAFAVNAVLTAAIVALSPGTLEEHLAGLESLAVGLTEDTSLGATLALLLLVGFYEEVVARGLLLTRIREALGGGFWLPAVISALLFAAGHFYQGVYGIVQTALLGLVFAVFTLRWGTLWPAIIAHSLINMFSVVQLGEFGLPDV